MNGIKLILDDKGNHLDSYTISLESFRSFRGPLFRKPVTGQELFFAVSYSKPALAARAIHQIQLRRLSKQWYLTFNLSWWYPSHFLDMNRRAFCTLHCFIYCNGVCRPRVGVCCYDGWRMVFIYVAVRKYVPLLELQALKRVDNFLDMNLRAFWTFFCVHSQWWCFLMYGASEIY